MTEAPPIEAQTTHLCELARLTDELAEGAKHEHGDRLAALGALTVSETRDGVRRDRRLVGPHLRPIAARA